jgi:hypothetical protein
MTATRIVVGGIALSVLFAGGASAADMPLSAITDHWLARFVYQYSAARALDNIIASISGTPAIFQAYPRWHYGEVALVYLFPVP